MVLVLDVFWPKNRGKTPISYSKTLIYQQEKKRIFFMTSFLHYDINVVITISTFTFNMTSTIVNFIL